MMDRYMLSLRILVTLLILTMLLPEWGVLSASHLLNDTSVVTEHVMTENLMTENVVRTVSALGR
jgi:hypothetical protein